ncbi:MAG: PadR family transcriptional regulator [Chloroflexi bacterium]|nr:PadR family transcriptional regulator [Chloroflexota bacterium]
MVTQVEGSAGLESAEYWEGLIKKSVSRYFLLGMLYQRPMHGYEIARNIETCCEGWCRPTDAMIYPTIKELVSGGYVECVSEIVGGRTRKVCHLTPRGEEAYRTASRVWASVLPYLAQSVKSGGAAISLEADLDGCRRPA